MLSTESKILELLSNEGVNDILLTGGGIIPQKDMDELEKIGTGKLFGPGTPIDETLNYILPDVTIEPK